MTNLVVRGLGRAFLCLSLCLSVCLAAARNRNFHRPARDEALVGRAEGPAHSTRRVHISVRDSSPPRPT
eukprot:scaffold79735_cov64-Phaeocystis_antarctica.AAC.1